MPRLDYSVKSVMDVLGDIDRYLDDESERLYDLEGPSVYETVYRRIINGDVPGYDSGWTPARTGDGVVVIPGIHNVSCQKTLLVCMFPLYGALGERYPDDVLEIRLSQARKYVEACPSTANVIFYGLAWDSALWRIHRDSSVNCNSFLKLFMAIYTRLKS